MIKDKETLKRALTDMDIQRQVLLGIATEDNSEYYGHRVFYIFDKLNTNTKGRSNALCECEGQDITFNKDTIVEEQNMTNNYTLFLNTDSWEWKIIDKEIANRELMLARLQE